MSKLLFEVEPDGDWLIATCHDPEMATQAKSIEELPAMIRDLVLCRFEPGDKHLKWPISLHFAKDPQLAPMA
jgi:hypothetical protein